MIHDKQPLSRQNKRTAVCSAEQRLTVLNLSSQHKLCLCKSFITRFLGLGCMTFFSSGVQDTVVTHVRDLFCLCLFGPRLDERFS